MTTEKYTYTVTGLINGQRVRYTELDAEHARRVETKLTADGVPGVEVWSRMNEGPTHRIKPWVTALDGMPMFVPPMTLSA